MSNLEIVAQDESVEYNFFLHRLQESCDGDLVVPDLTRDCLREATGEMLERLLIAVEEVIDKSSRRPTPLHAEVVSYGTEVKLMLKAVVRRRAEEPGFDSDSGLAQLGRPKVSQRRMSRLYQHDALGAGDFY